MNAWEKLMSQPIQMDSISKAAMDDYMTAKAKRMYDDARDNLDALDLAFASMSFSSESVEFGNKKKRQKPQLRSVDDDWGGG